MSKLSIASLNSPRNVRRVGLALAVATAAVIATLPAVAQVRVGEEGRANDANTRVGSGGYNTPRPNVQLVNPNDIALGNVTSGQGFRGVLTGDPRQPFGGRSGLPSDQFARRASPGGSSSAPPLPPGSTLQYYSASPVGNAPPGYVFNPNTGIYQAQVRPVAGGEDIQFGAPPGTAVVRPGADGSQQLIMPVMLRDANGALQTSVLTGTPLLGVRTLPGRSDEERFLLSRSTDYRRGNEPPLDPATLRRLRDELKQTMLTDPAAAEQLRQLDASEEAKRNARTSPLDRGANVTGRPTDATLTPGRATDPDLSRNAAVPLGQPGATPGVTPGAPLTGAPVAGANLPGAGPATPRDPAAELAARNPLLAELRRLDAERERLRAEKAKADKAAGENPAERPADRSAERPGDRSDVPRAPGTDGVPRVPNTPAEKVPPSTRPSTPVAAASGGGLVPALKVGPLSEQQSSAAMRDLLSGAEQLLTAGRFASAADRYEAASRFAPADATLVVARAHAELGGGFFARAENSLRRAVATDPAVLGAQYDLRKTLGDDRVSTLVSDLKRIALDDKGNATPVLLLAYLAYNSGDEGRAVSLLAEADTRRPNDPLIAALRSRWAGDNK